MKIATLEIRKSGKFLLSRSTPIFQQCKSAVNLNGSFRRHGCQVSEIRCLTLLPSSFARSERKSINFAGINADLVNRNRFYSSASALYSADKESNRSWVEWAQGKPISGSSIESSKDKVTEKVEASEIHVDPPAHVIQDGNEAATATAAVNEVPVEVLEQATKITEAVETVPLDAPNFVVNFFMTGIEHIHLGLDLPYWQSIVVLTVGLRLCLIPIALKTMQGSARMAVLRPEMEKVTNAFKSDPNITPEKQKIYQQEMRSLFVKHKVNPIRSMLWPLFQFPLFIALFMALRTMGSHYPGLATGGAYWFTDISVADPYVILPALNAVSFLIMIELGGDGVKMQPMVKNVMRGLGVGLVPLTMDMPVALFLYWCTNNCISIVQTNILKRPAVRKYLDIPTEPKAAEQNELKISNPFAAIKDSLAKERGKKLDAEAEILHGTKPTNNSSGAASSTAQQPPAVYDTPLSSRSKGKKN